MKKRTYVDWGKAVHHEKFQKFITTQFLAVVNLNDQAWKQKPPCIQCSIVLRREPVLVVSNTTKTEITVFNYFFDALKFVLVVTSTCKLLTCVNILFFNFYGIIFCLLERVLM